MRGGVSGAPLYDDHPVGIPPVTFSDSPLSGVPERLAAWGGVEGANAATPPGRGIEDAPNADNDTVNAVLDALSAIVRREVVDVAVIDKQVVSVPPKVSDMIKAAELLGRRYGLFAEKPGGETAPVVIVDDIAVK